VHFAEDDYLLQIEIQQGQFETTVSVTKKTIAIPRDRSILKKPVKYQANLAKTIMEPRSYLEAINCGHKAEWMSAISDELKSLIEMGLGNSFRDRCIKESSIEDGFLK
jgi:hypothetical protein